MITFTVLERETCPPLYCYVIAQNTYRRLRACTFIGHPFRIEKPSEKNVYGIVGVPCPMVRRPYRNVSATAGLFLNFSALKETLKY